MATLFGVCSLTDFLTNIAEYLSNAGSVNASPSLQANLQTVHSDCPSPLLVIKVLLKHLLAHSIQYSHQKGLKKTSISAMKTI
eukprot:2332989-Rhodomonas_salina.1